MLVEIDSDKLGNSHFATLPARISSTVFDLQVLAGHGVTCQFVTCIEETNSSFIHKSIGAIASIAVWLDGYVLFKIYRLYLSFYLRTIIFQSCIFDDMVFRSSFIKIVLYTDKVNRNNWIYFTEKASAHECYLRIDVLHSCLQNNFFPFHNLFFQLLLLNMLLAHFARILLVLTK